MADENQELQQLAQSVRNAMQGLDEATKKSTVGLDAFGRELKTVPGQFAKGMGSFAKTVGQGDTNFKALNSVVDLAADAMAGLAKTIPLAGEGLAAGIKATAEASKFMLEQMDQSTKAFNDLGKVGALTASGMSGLQKQFIASGLQLNTFVKQVSENSVALARFRGLTGDGAEEFSQVAGELTRGTDDSLRRLGMNAEEIGDTVGAFVTQQTRLGRAQTMTNAELTEGAKRYGQELDLLSKVTGLSRESIQKQQDAALSESKFRANYELMMANGQEKQAQALMTLQTRMQSFGSELGQGVRDLSSGVANTEAAQKLVNSTGGAALDIMARLKSGAIDQDQAQNEIIAAMERNKSAQLQIASQIGNTAGVYIETAQMQDAINAKNAGSFEKAKKTQDAQIDGADDLTNKTVKAQKSMEGLNIEIQKLGFTFLPQAATAVQSMTSAMEKFVKYVNKTIGADLDETPAAGTTTGMDMGGAEIITAGAAELTKEEQKKYGVTASGRPAPTGKMTTASQQDLAAQGLRIKQGDVQAPGEEISQDLINLAKQVQSGIPGFQHFTGFNDRFHNEKAPNSKHTSGLAMDFVLAQRPSREEGAKIVDMLKQMGATYAQDEYNNASAKAVGAGHIHAEVSAARGAILSGPTSGYKPNLTMHGTEAIVPLNNPNVAAAMPGLGGMDPGLMLAQLEKMDEMVTVLKSQLGVSEKLLRYQS
jgi:hypothetical protein